MTIRGRFSEPQVRGSSCGFNDSCITYVIQLAVLVQASSSILVSEAFSFDVHISI